MEGLWLGHTQKYWAVFGLYYIALNEKKMSRRPDVSSTKRAAEVNPGVVRCGTSSECAAQECAVVLRPESSWVVMCQVSFPPHVGKEGACLLS